jgi:hypothetical protein
VGRTLKPVIRCRSCRSSVDREERPWAWVPGSGAKADNEYIRYLPLCERCYERRAEDQAVKDLEKWPDLEETLEDGYRLIQEDELEDFSAPESSFLMPGEKTTW